MSNTRSKGGGDRKEDVVMGFDEPVTHSVPATLGLTPDPLSADEEQRVRDMIDRRWRHPLDGDGLLARLLATLDAARAATRVEADLRALREAMSESDKSWAANDQDGIERANEHLRVAARAILAATEAPREVWTDVPGHGDTQYLAATEAPREPISCSCDWPGCQGQCHTGDSCPCHPTEDRDEQIERIAAAGDEWRDSLVTDEQAALTKDYLAGKIDRNEYLNRSFPDRATPRPR